jgi:hypothetical protein
MRFQKVIFLAILIYVMYSTITTAEPPKALPIQ